jgi:hypothetical protein
VTKYLETEEIHTDQLLNEKQYRNCADTIELRINAVQIPEIQPFDRGRPIVISTRVMANNKRRMCDACAVPPGLL